MSVGSKNTDSKQVKNHEPPISINSTATPCPTLLYVPIVLGNEKCLAMLDSGSGVSVISLEMLLKANPTAAIKHTPISLVAANNTRIEVVGQCGIKINFGPFKKKLCFIVVESSLSHPVILGSDWMLGAKADIIMSNRTICLPGHQPIAFTVASSNTRSHSIAAIKTDRPITLYPAYLQSFEAGTGGLVTCKVKGMKVPDGSIVCIPTAEEQLDIALTCSNNLVKVPFANALNTETSLWPNAPIARAMLFSEEEIEHEEETSVNSTSTMPHENPIPVSPIERYKYLKEQLDSMNIPEQHRPTIEEMIKEFHDVFSCSKYDIGKTSILEMDIETDGTICYTNQYPFLTKNLQMQKSKKC